MNSLWEVPISSVVSLSPEKAVTIIRAIFRAECGYAKLGPSALTISQNIMTTDGGIDAEINAAKELAISEDCIFQSGITGFQIKSGTTFKPWTKNSIRGELLNSKGELCSEVERLLHRKGHYTIICTGHDLTPKQRNDAKNLIMDVLSEKRSEGYKGKIAVLGASQIAEFAERYPGTASLLIANPVQEAWTFKEWQHDAHMANTFEESPEQAEIISHLQKNLQGETKHTRILGEAGLGKTRIVLESLKDESLSPYVLYIQHGSQFGRSKLFRQLLQSDHDKPLILVIDELPESELSDIWRHLKPRCGHLKIVSMDHGLDKSFDEEIDRLNAPHLPNDSIKKILAHRVGESLELDRWVKICEGSPRVALAVADNLCANPSDLLKPPSTIPIWARFLHGYGKRDEASARQIDCTAQHLALFSRFGFDSPVGEEAEYIAELICKVDSTIGRARFQEIVQELRSRRVLQGSRTLFFVPKALHIYLWKQFWECYGRGFNFERTFTSMPESLHVWFMNMFKYAGQGDAVHVVDGILDLGGVFAKKETLTSGKESQFLSILAEANPAAVLRLLEATIGTWSDEEILNLSESRQNFVWTLGKIAVWPSYTVRAMQLLIRLAVNESSHYSNHSTGTLLDLFRIGPEWAVTESSPGARLPAFLELLHAQNDACRRLGLKIADSTLNPGSLNVRVVGPEYQGMKERAKLWKPKTDDDWYQAYFVYFQALVSETKNWPSNFRPEVCISLLNAVRYQIRIPPCTELAFKVLDTLANDDAMRSEGLNNFFWHWREYKGDGEFPEITKRLQVIERRYIRRNLLSRFNRYVLDVDFVEWEEEHREQRGKPRSRAKMLVKALARRIARSSEKFSEICHLLTPEKHALGLSFFGEQLAQKDPNRVFLPQLIELTLRANHQTCLYGYLLGVRKSDDELYDSIISSFFDSKSTAWLGAQITLISDYDDDLFVRCLNALEKGWISPQLFSSIGYGGLIDNVPKRRLGALFQLLNTHQSEKSLRLLIELLDLTPFDKASSFDAEFVFEVISRSVPRNGDEMYCWNNVSQKLIKWDESCVLPLLDVLLGKMGEDFQLSYNSYISPLANELVQASPSGAWGVIKKHFEKTLPKWQDGLLNWLKGMNGFGESGASGSIADLPLQGIFDWIEEDPELRAGLIAHVAPPTLDDINGGKLTRELLHKYAQIGKVERRISASFRLESHMGPTSVYLKRKKDKFLRWLTAGFDVEITRWVESEIEYLNKRIEQEEIDEERSRFD